MAGQQFHFAFDGRKNVTGCDMESLTAGAEKGALYTDHE